jgi:hypothetical protein
MYGDGEGTKPFLDDASSGSSEAVPSSRLGQEDPLRDVWLPTSLWPFTLEHRIRMLEYLNDQIRSLQESIKPEDGKDISLLVIAAALEEVHEKLIKRKAYSKGRTEDTISKFSDDQLAQFQCAVEESAVRVEAIFASNKLQSHDVEAIKQALLELRAMLANPKVKLLGTSKGVSEK